MIAWLNPIGLALLALTAVPIVIHLLLRRRATRVMFPSVRFIAASERSAMRMRRPSDVVLLLIRVGIVVLAAVAAAGPLFLSDARVRGLGERTIRAVVVDTSASVDSARATEAATAEARGAFLSRQFDSPRLVDALSRATAWVSSSEPAQREIVVISDFQRGTMDGDDVGRVPATIGFRALRVPRVPTAAGAIDAPPVFHEGDVFNRAVHLDESSTGATLTRTSASGGLDIAADHRVAERITRAIAAAGAVAPSADQPFQLHLGTRQVADTKDWARDWTFETARALFASPLAREVPLRATQRNGALVVDVDAPEDSLIAARVTQAALDARFDIEALAEHEPATIPQHVSDSWMRMPSAPAINDWRRSKDSDGRWLWLAALGLMGIEMFVRRVQPRREAEEERHAA